MGTKPALSLMDTALVGARRINGLDFLIAAQQNTNAFPFSACAAVHNRHHSVQNVNCCGGDSGGGCRPHLVNDT